MLGGAQHAVILHIRMEVLTSCDRRVLLYHTSSQNGFQQKSYDNVLSLAD
jgi:hypothetical protein